MGNDGGKQWGNRMRKQHLEVSEVVVRVKADVLGQAHRTPGL